MKPWERGNVTGFALIEAGNLMDGFERPCVSGVGEYVTGFQGLMSANLMDEF